MALWVFLLLVTAVVFITVHAYVLPKFFLKVRYNYDTLPDRGVKVIDEVNGRSILYEPDVKIRKYIQQYILSERDGKKQFICKIGDGIRYIEYDVVLFDEKGNSFKVLNVKELIKNKGYTRITDLPEKTAYVSVILNSVNDEKFRSRVSKKADMKGVAIYLVLSAAVEITGVICIKVLLGKIFGGLFFESFLILGEPWLFTALICAGVIIINVLFTLGTLLLKSKKDKGVELNV